jgi:hypothetical protein
MDYLMEDHFIILDMAPFREPSALSDILGRLAGKGSQSSGSEGFRLGADWRASTLWGEYLSWGHVVKTSLPPRRSLVRHHSWMLWKVRTLRKNAVMYFGKEPKTLDELKQWTRLRWSRVTRESVEF